MINLNDDYEEKFGFDDADDEQNINAILNDQHESRLGVLKNLLVILLIIGVGIGVFWGSFILGKKVFTSSLPETMITQDTINLEEELADFAMPEENILYEIEDMEAKKEEPEAPEQKQQPAASTPVEKPQEKVVPKVEKETKTASKPVMYKVIVGSYSKLDNAKVLEKDLKQKGFDVYIAPVTIKGNPMWRVQVGAFDTLPQAKDLIRKVKAVGNDAFYIQE